MKSAISLGPLGLRETTYPRRTKRRGRFGMKFSEEAYKLAQVVAALYSSVEIEEEPSTSTQVAYAIEILVECERQLADE